MFSGPECGVLPCPLDQAPLAFYTLAPTLTPGPSSLLIVKEDHRALRSESTQIAVDFAQQRSLQSGS